jgi:3-hydroxy acid dehydrogenase/malonic semialdehyde reductase
MPPAGRGHRRDLPENVRTTGRRPRKPAAHQEKQMTGTSGTALVTGASSGIGRAVAVALATARYKVLAVGRDPTALETLQRECGATPLAIDVRNTAGFADIIARHQVDVLVNNAGVLTTRAAFQDIDPADIDVMIDVNFKAPLHLTRLALPAMIARGYGHIFFIGSSAGLVPQPNAGVYGASKAGVGHFSDSLRCDLLGTGVRVSEISPGRVETQLYRTTVGKENAQAELYDGYDPILPNDIAALIMAALNMPRNVDVSRMEVFPTSQAVGGSRIVKTGK